MTGSADKLKALLRGHLSAQEEAQKKAQEKMAEEDRWATGCGIELRDIVQPVFATFTTLITQEGHKATINDRISGHVSPNIEFAFTPKSISPHTFISPSTLSFVCSGNSKQVEVKREINTTSGKAPISAFDIIRRPDPVPRPITEAWVERQVIEFVEAVLRANTPA
jgi:hypothetical protein